VIRTIKTTKPILSNNTRYMNKHIGLFCKSRRACDFVLLIRSKYVFSQQYKSLFTKWWWHQLRSDLFSQEAATVIAWNFIISCFIISFLLYQNKYTASTNQRKQIQCNVQRATYASHSYKTSSPWTVKLSWQRSYISILWWPTNPVN